MSINDVCPMCGYGVMQRVSGTFKFDVPDSIPGGPILVPSAAWLECSGCHESILRGKLLDAIDAELAVRSRDEKETA